MLGFQIVGVVPAAGNGHKRVKTSSRQGVNKRGQGGNAPRYFDPIQLLILLVILLFLHPYEMGYRGLCVSHRSQPNKFATS